MELPAIKNDEQVITHIGYTTSYNSKTLNPNWVAYELTREEVQGECKGKTSFCWDPDVKGRKSGREDYKNDLKSYIRTVNDIEKMVRMDFFTDLSDSVEETVEGQVNRNVWGLK